MAAGVHASGVSGNTIESRRFLDRERVHIGAEPNPTRIAATCAQNADDTGLSDAAVDLDTPGRETLGHDRGRAFLLESDFGMGVQVAADRDQLVLVAPDTVDDAHRHSPDRRRRSLHEGDGK